MVSSLDGFIAKKDKSVSWFETSVDYAGGVDSENPEEILKTIDCYVMGSNTYEFALELSKEHGWPYGEKPTMVLSSRKLSDGRKNVEFHSGDLVEFAKERLVPHYKNVWVVGGAGLVREFIRLRLADEIRVTILPIILGDGLLFFNYIGQEQLLCLNDARAYKNGSVELCYKLI